MRRVVESLISQPLSRDIWSSDDKSDGWRDHGRNIITGSTMLNFQHEHGAKYQIGYVPLQRPRVSAVGRVALLLE
jgi:hypothetical protein